MRRTPMRNARLAAATAAALLLSLTACSGGSGSGTPTTDQLAANDAAGGAGSTAEKSVAEPLASPAAGDYPQRIARNAADLLQQQAVIKTGAVSLRSDDVGKTRFDVQALVDEHNGQVSDDKTETDKTGSPLRSRMVLRVPAPDFETVMDRLAKLGQLVSTSSSAEDVTTQLIDVNARIAVQQRSVDRVRQLLARAQSIRDIMAIESQLSERQAELDSLTQQQAYLNDQTSLSTIRVSIERKPEAVVRKKHETRTGFLAGLESGWHGLKATVVTVLTVVGAVLPFLVVLVLLGGVPAWLLVRRMRRTSPAALAGPAPESTP